MSDATPSPHLAIIWHSRTGASEALAAAALEGAQSEAEALSFTADAVTPETLLAAGGYLFVGPENLGSLTGAMKEMFDRCYYPVLGRLEGRPYATIITAGSDGEGAQRQLDRIVTGWRLRRVADRVIVNLGAQTADEILAPKCVPRQDIALARDLGAALSTGITLGLF